MAKVTLTFEDSAENGIKIETLAPEYAEGDVSPTNAEILGLTVYRMCGMGIAQPMAQVLVPELLHALRSNTEAAEAAKELPPKSEG